MQVMCVCLLIVLSVGRAASVPDCPCASGFPLLRKGFFLVVHVRTGYPPSGLEKQIPISISRSECDEVFTAMSEPPSLLGLLPEDAEPASERSCPENVWSSGLEVILHDLESKGSRRAGIPASAGFLRRPSHAGGVLADQKQPYNK